MLPNPPSREVGTYPVSIATSIPLEVLMGVHEDQPRGIEPPYLNYQQLWINVATVLRNYHSSMKVADSANLLDQELTLAVLAEMRKIQAIIEETTHRKLTCHYYYNDYESVKKLFPGAILWKPNTDRQKMNYAMMRDVPAMVVKEWVAQGEQIQIIDSVQKPNDFRLLFLTHQPIDIIYMAFNSNDALLESNTGRIKKSQDWWTKFKGNNAIERIPFNPYTIQVFGDSGDVFKPHPIEYRRMILDIANKRKWDHTTSIDRMLQSIRLFDNNMLSDHFKSIKVKF